ncbi:hypothetical protein Sjap_024200 [Stephania japonica]|uniref:Uncharacterized protein n=1 Tax=Stephania japonica TaxID=461633 RepID=A0AAP0EIA6_9MAGN
MQERSTHLMNVKCVKMHDQQIAIVTSSTSSVGTKLPKSRCTPLLMSLETAPSSLLPAGHMNSKPTIASQQMIPVPT